MFMAITPFAALGGDMITRHNRIRNLIAQIGSEANLSPVLEKKGILGPTDTTKRRPAMFPSPSGALAEDSP